MKTYPLFFLLIILLIVLYINLNKVFSIEKNQVNTKELNTKEKIILLDSIINEK